MSEVLHYLDAQTKMTPGMKRLLRRPDAAPRHPNPVRRFREELRLTREEFAELMSIPVETLRAWERDKGSIVPGHQRLKRLVEIARRNQYPLYFSEIQRYAEESRKKS